MIHLLLAVIYLSFISLGLPDSLLGAAWPKMYLEFGVPVSFAGIISMIISMGTIISSLQSDRLTKKLGTGKVTAISVGITAAALFGFSISGSFWMLCLWAIPYGLGAGSVDASLNNYVALHYASRHMSWLHCMWGVGTSLGPYIMEYALTGGQNWNMGYRYISYLQIILTAVLLCSLPLWKKAGGLAALFFIGITAGRALSGFITMKLSDPQMIRMGQIIILAGILFMLLPFGFGSQAGLLMVGLGCAPIYPCIIHSTPDHFGADKSQAVIGVQMASAYMGSLLMPPVFGLLAQNISASLFPVFLLLLLILMVFMHEKLLKKTA
nr:MFS transporter [uncultured Blautia sp.]